MYPVILPTTVLIRLSRCSISYRSFFFFSFMQPIMKLLSHIFNFYVIPSSLPFFLQNPTPGSNSFISQDRIIAVTNHPKPQWRSLIKCVSHSCKFQCRPSFLGQLSMASPRCSFTLATLWLWALGVWCCSLCCQLSNKQKETILHESCVLVLFSIYQMSLVSFSNKHLLI